MQGYHRTAHPGYFTQTYRIGDHLYSTAGSEAQRPPNRGTHCRLPYQWQQEHHKEVTAARLGQERAQQERLASRGTAASAASAATLAHSRSTAAIASKVEATGSLKADLEATLSAVDAEMAALDGSMAATSASLESKRGPLEAVSKYNALRQSARPPTERLCDPVKHDLEQMSAMLRESMRLIESALSAQQSELMRLRVKKGVLEADLADKAACLAVDEKASDALILHILSGIHSSAERY